MRILGIDQGIANMGYSILEDDKLITYGCINTTSKDFLEERFFVIYSRLKKIIEEYKPEIICCEKLFYTSPKEGNRNKSASIIYTNMITGVLAALCGEFSIELRMFVPSKVKKAVCNNGKAEKDDMITKIKSLYPVESDKTKYEHVCDSIAIAFTCYIENKEAPEIRKAFEDNKNLKIERYQLEEDRRLNKIDKERKKLRRTIEKERKRAEKLKIQEEKALKRLEKEKKNIGKKD